MTTITMAVTLDAQDLAHQLDDDEAHAFIALLDESRGDWDFTLRMADHYDKLRAEHAAEEAEDNAKRAALKAAP
jgi:hypothetical protein